MRILFKTNLDQYKANCFPQNLDSSHGVPRVGDYISVTEVFGGYYNNKKLPLRLEVKSVIWLDKGVVCELWYNKTDSEVAKNAGAKVFG